MLMGVTLDALFEMGSQLQDLVLPASRNPALSLQFLSACHARPSLPLTFISTPIFLIFRSRRLRQVCSFSISSARSARRTSSRSDYCRRRHLPPPALAHRGFVIGC